MKKYIKILFNSLGLKNFFINQLPILNINYDGIQFSKQKKVLVSYSTQPFLMEDQEVYHPNLLHIKQIIKYFIDTNWIIDICDCNNENSIPTLRDREYDLIFGFGRVYKKMITMKNHKFSILLVTENNPLVVKEKYAERVNYFRTRHPQSIRLRKSVIRNNYYEMEQFLLSDYALVFNSHYNAASMKEYFNKVYTININGLYNYKFSFSSIDVSVIKKSFVWFGSRGVVHKGLDILVDVFKLLPACTLHIYGVDKSELSIINHKISSNIVIHPKINVMTDIFINQVVLKNLFVISLSCSEGMQSGIATCMLHGLIPVVTRETGYNPHSSIFELVDYRIESVVSSLMEITKLPNQILERKRKEVYEYAHNNFTLETFDRNFRKIMNELTEYGN